MKVSVNENRSISVQNVSMDFAPQEYMVGVPLEHARRDHLEATLVGSKGSPR